MMMSPAEKAGFARPTMTRTSTTMCLMSHSTERTEPMLRRNYQLLHLMISKALLMAVLPLAVRWATSKERRILEQGVALTPTQLEDARRVGVIEAKRVRLQAVDQIPWPVHPMLRQAAEATGLLSPDTIGL